MKSSDQLVLAILVSLVGLTPGHAQSAKTIESQTGSKTVSSLEESVYSKLFNVMNELDFTGWQLAKTGFYVDMNGKFQQVLIYSNSANQKNSPYKYEKDSRSKRDEVLKSHSFRSGEEGILRECGCHAVAQKIFRRGNRFVTFEGFQFDRSLGANAGYNFLRSGSTTVIKRGNGSSEDGQSISFWKGNFFFRVFTQEENDDEAKEVVSQIAKIAASKVVSSVGAGNFMRLLPSLDRVKGSEKIVLGPLTAKHYFSVPYIKALKIDRSKGALVADYQVYHPHRERLKVLCIDYGDPLLAQKAYFNFASNISQLKPPLNGGPNASPRSLFKINKRFLLCELKPKGKLVVIIGARKKASPGVLARQI